MKRFYFSISSTAMFAVAAAMSVTAMTGQDLGVKRNLLWYDEPAPSGSRRCRLAMAA
jgi:hypothetical protein